MENIFEKLGQWFKPNQENEIKVIGFYTTNNNALFIYNSWNDRFDNSTDIDLSDKSFKYENATMTEAQVCMDIEGNVGDLQELTLSY
jgi:hypothetical protein